MYTLCGYCVYNMSTMYAMHVMLNNDFTVWKYHLLQNNSTVFCVAYYQLQVNNECLWITSQ